MIVGVTFYYHNKEWHALGIAKETLIIYYLKTNNALLLSHAFGD